MKRSGLMFEHSRSYAPFNVLTATRLEDRRLDTGTMEKMTQHQPGRTRADDSNLNA